MYWHVIYVLYSNTQNILYVKKHLTCVFSLSQRFLLEFLNATYQFGNSIMLLKVPFNESETIIILNFIYKNSYDEQYVKTLFYLYHTWHSRTCFGGHFRMGVSSEIAVRVRYDTQIHVLIFWFWHPDFLKREMPTA
jgi:hypothetical protein